MPKNKIEDLRNHLFLTLEKLLDEDDPMDVEHAQAIAKVAKVIVDSANVEVKLLGITGGGVGTGFIQPSEDPKQEPPRLNDASRKPEKELNFINA